MKPGRNDPCPCGSGKKYKHCCERKEAAPVSALPSAPPPAEVAQLIAMFNAGRHFEVEARARQLLAQFPRFATGWKLLGVSLHMHGKDCLPAFRKAVELFPDDAEAYSNLGNALKDREQYAEAAESYRRAVALKPSLSGAHYNLGCVLQETGQATEAVACYRKAIKIKPDFSDAYNNLGNALKDLGQLNEAVASYRRAMEIDPNNLRARSNLLFVLNYSAQFSPVLRLEEAKKYGRTVARLAKQRFTSWLCSDAPQRLRVGILSGDLRDHPVGRFLENALAHLDHTRIELVAYDTNPKPDDLTARIRPHFVAWRTLMNRSDENVARMIHADGVHVLLDLSGHTAHNRLPVFAYKPAPVQAGWLGYLSTTGVTEMDYVLADVMSAPEPLQKLFTESVCYLPDTMLCFTEPTYFIPVTPSHRLAKGAITFGNFQDLSRVSDDVLAAWGEIFAALPEARLRMQSKQLGDPVQREHLTQRLQRAGIAPDRVSLHGSMPREAYLAAHADVDVILDAFPYTGCTTTCEALWMGVPTLTLAGDYMLARQGASIMTAAGLADWVASSREEYIAKAVALGGDPARLAALRAGLRQQVLASPLFDAPRFAKHFEDALWGMWRTHENRLTQA